MGKTFLYRCAVALFLIVSAPIASGAGLGKLTVLSVLGQPFRGEIELVSVTREEQGLLNVRLASPEAFRQADVPFTPFISTLKVAIDTRPSGEQFVRVSSTQPLNEPFVDFLIELYWTSGRLVRTYTALLDPPISFEGSGSLPEVKPLPPAQVLDGASSASAPVFVEPQPAGSRGTMDSGAQPQGVDVEPGLPRARSGTPGVVVPEPAAQLEAISGPTNNAVTEYAVKRGDTLSKIAVANKAVDVSLDQMLVSLFRANRESFSGKNMNRLKVGAVLRVPDADLAGSVPAAEARREVRAQAANWNAYRERLAALASASSAATSVASSQSASGKVSSTTEGGGASAPDGAKEVLKLSKGEGDKPGGAGAKGAPDRVRTLEEELAARNKALGEANQRLAALEKTVKDMELLMEMKSKGMSAAQKAAEATKPSSAEAETAKGQKPSGQPGEPPLSGPKSEAAVAAPAEPPKAQDGQAASGMPPSPVIQEGPKAKPVPPPPPPPPPPSIVDDLMENPLILAGGVAALLGLGGLGFARYRRRTGDGDSVLTAKEDAKSSKKNSSVGSPDEGPEGDIEPAASPSPEPGSPTEGDPLDEVDDLLNYGRYDLAEQRLSDAISANPARHELQGKLLEVYAHRQDMDAFESLARELQDATGGRGPVWDRAVQLGYQLDPENTLYAAGGESEFSPTETVALGAGSLAAAGGMAAGSDLDFDLDVNSDGQVMATDIDLSGMEGANGEALATPTDIDISALGMPDAGEEPLALDGQLSGDLSLEDRVKVQALSPETIASASMGGIDLNMDVPEISPPPSGYDGVGPKALSTGMVLDFDANSLNPVASPTREQPAPDLDLSGIDLGLGSASAVTSGREGHDERWYDVQTKFDLAKAYQEMGDKEGAREVLQEVIAEGDAQQREAAEQVLASLG